MCIRDRIIREQKGKTAKISIADCLACSGCITSSETLLVQEQSIDKFISKIGSFTRGVILISPQSRASLANKWSLTEQQAQFVLANFFESKGVEAVLDIEVFIHLIRHWEWNFFKNRKGNDYHF